MKNFIDLGLPKMLLLFFLFFITILPAQNTFIEYKGRIVNANTNKPIEAASINIVSTNISTVTNSEGEFAIKVPDTTKDSKLRVTILGFKTFVANLSDIDTSKAVIRLLPAVTQLSEVSLMVYSDADKLVRNVFKNKTKTEKDNTILMTAFYRETIKRRQRNVSLTEAVVNILKQPYATTKKDEVKLIKARKRTDYKRLDTLTLKLQGGPFSALYLDVIKYPEYIFTEETFNDYVFSFDEPSRVNDKKVYVVNFVPRDVRQALSYFGKLFIDAENLALVSADYRLDLSNEAKSRNLLVKRKPRNIVVYPLEANYHVDYKKTAEKWYYSYSTLSLKFKVNKKREWFNKVYTLSSEMVVTDWVESTQTRINANERLKPSVIITDAISGFSDPNFWGKDNLIEPDKSIQNAIQKIQRQLKRSEKG